MSLISTRRWESLERWRSTLFLVAGGLYAVNAVVVGTGIVTGSEQMTTLLGETFNAAGWVIALIGLLGVYAGVADRSRWLSRIGAVCAAIGVVVFAVVSGLTLVYYAGIVEGDIQRLVPLILPGTIIGSVLSFLLMSIASLRTDVYPRSIGVLLLVPPLIVVASILRGAAGFDSAIFLLGGVIIPQILVTVAIGFRLRSSGAATARPEPTLEEAAN